MREELLAVVEELKRLRKEGVNHVNVSDDSIQGLAKFAKSSAEIRAEVKAEVRALIPEHIRTATADDFKQVLEHAPKAAKEAAKKAAGPKFPPAPLVVLPEGDKGKRWEALREMVLNCPTCNKHKRDGYRVVFGVGNIDADIFFCGEAPGAEEEEQGEPFVGKAGQLLTKMIGAMGTKREEVYIGNIMNWRPEMPTRTGNRAPTEEEMKFCLPYLAAQVEVVKPKVIVALGVTAAKGLLGFDSFRTLREIKGEWQEFRGIPVMPTYHPSYLLRNSSNRDKREAWVDLLKVMEKVGLPISEKQQSYFL